MRMLFAFLLLAAQDTPVNVEFRVFAGIEEITASTRLRIMPTGSRDAPLTVSEGKRLLATIAPAIYDVQALRLRSGGIVAIRWAERLVVMHYPDEAGQHLEVINFDEGYGALQLRAARGPITAYDVTVFPAGDRTTPAGEPVDGDGYRLFVLQAGRYDIRVRPAGTRAEDEEPRWLLHIEVPANRTRMKILDEPPRRPFFDR
jgi:hypothetical protein